MEPKKKECRTVKTIVFHQKGMEKSFLLQTADSGIAGVGDYEGGCSGQCQQGAYTWRTQPPRGDAEMKYEECLMPELRGNKKKKKGNDSIARTANGTVGTVSKYSFSTYFLDRVTTAVYRQGERLAETASMEILSLLHNCFCCHWLPA